MDSLRQTFGFLRAEHEGKLVSPTEHVYIDRSNNMDKQLMPVAMDQDDPEDRADENKEDRGLGRDVVTEDQDLAGASTGGGGASGASAPGVRRREHENEDKDEEGEEGREARKTPVPMGPSREERER